MTRPPSRPPTPPPPQPGGLCSSRAGPIYLDADVTLEAKARFEGTVTMPVNRRLSMTRSFDLPTYAAAFGDEELGFKKAFQALLNWADHDSLDLGGRRIEVTAPIDMQAAVNNKTTFATRRVIRNGQFNVIDGPGLDAARSSPLRRATIRPTSWC